MNHTSKKTTPVIFSVIMAVVCFACTNNVAKDHTEAAPIPFIDQLFILQEYTADDPCEKNSGESQLFGGMYLTKKGNIILNPTDTRSDTVRCYWGTYRLTDSTISYLLTDEYYYRGQWDVWDDSVYLKGQTRKVQASEVTLFKSSCDTMSFFLPYSKEEIQESANRYIDQRAYGRYFFPYKETENMKFYTWYFKQIPVLADL